MTGLSSNISNGAFGSHKSARVPQERPPQECPMSHKSVPEGVPQECPTRVSNKNVMHECPVTVQQLVAQMYCGKQLLGGAVTSGQATW